VWYGRWKSAIGLGSVCCKATWVGAALIAGYSVKIYFQHEGSAHTFMQHLHFYSCVSSELICHRMLGILATPVYEGRRCELET
jgi:hypothetical protein